MVVAVLAKFFANADKAHSSEASGHTALLWRANAAKNKTGGPETARQHH